MDIVKSNQNRRNFLKLSALSGGGMMLGFNWGCSSSSNAQIEDEIIQEVVRELPKEWYEVNAYLKIGDNGMITIMCPNPELGQNIKTSVPMLLAEELDANWDDVIVEQANYDPARYTGQNAGGSRGIFNAWNDIRKVGAAAKYLLLSAAAKRWNVSANLITTDKGVCYYQQQKLTYAELATEAAQLELPNEEDITLKQESEFKIIGTGRGNVELSKILKGETIFGIDYHEAGMLYAVVERPPFGGSLGSVDDSEARTINGVVDIFSFDNKVAVVANSTWQAMKARKALRISWSGNFAQENSQNHKRDLNRYIDRPGEVSRNDGDITRAFSEADEVIESYYEYPYIPHSCMEPLNCFANITESSALIVAPAQSPHKVKRGVARVLGRKEEDIEVHLTRMGGGFGRKSYSDYPEEAAQISNRIKRPIKLVYSREDDLRSGRYRPIIKFRYRASIKNNELTGMRYMTTSPYYRQYGTRQNKFPAGALENFYTEAQGGRNNVTGGIWRAPFINTMAVAEQSFLDEVAEKINKDPFQFRRDLLTKAKTNPVGQKDYDSDRMVSVLDLVEAKSQWQSPRNGVYKGMSLYFGHLSYVAVVVDVVLRNNSPKISKVYIAVDCGIVVNPLAAANQVEGGVLDAVGHVMYPDFTFRDGRPVESNFDKYRLMRISEAPDVEVYFVDSKERPTGLGEPPFPPVGAAVANAIAKATGKRLRNIPFIKDKTVFN